MTYNPNFADLQPYPFEKLRNLTADIKANTQYQHIPLTLGEPKHAPPEFVIEALSNPAQLRTFLSTYPASKGVEPLREAIAAWLAKRFDVTCDPELQVIPVNGTREALFSFAQAMLSGRNDSYVLMPNPFYQIYEGAALLAGARPYFVDNQRNQDYQQDFASVPEHIWQATELVYLCSPGNPTGQIIPEESTRQLIELAHEHDFIIAADECYSELYFDESAPPTSLLAVSDAMNNPSFARCVVFHSLSKRSNLPGLRSGFVAGDASILADFLKYRTYHGCALSPHHQYASTLAWQDEQHVIANRALYQQKFAAVTPLLAEQYEVHQPDGGFYHWLATPIDDQAFCCGLLEEFNVSVMPGSFLARQSDMGNPGTGHVRVAWVAPAEDCLDAAQRLAAYAEGLAR